MDPFKLVSDNRYYYPINLTKLLYNDVASENSDEQ